MAGRPVPGALNPRDGGDKDESRPLGCRLEKRPPCPWLTPIEQIPNSHKKPRPVGGEFYYNRKRGDILSVIYHREISKRVGIQLYVSKV